MVFGNPALRTLLLFGWLADFCIVPEGLAAPLWAVLILWAPAGAGGADQLAAAAAFVQSLAPQGRARAFGLAQSGLLAVQGPGHPGRRRRGQLHRGPGRGRPGGPAGPVHGRILAMAWTVRRGDVIAAMRARSAAGR